MRQESLEIVPLPGAEFCSVVAVYSLRCVKDSEMSPFWGE